MKSEIQQLVSEFTERITQVIEGSFQEKLSGLLGGLLDGGGKVLTKRRPGRPPNGVADTADTASAASATKHPGRPLGSKNRKKMPRQLCPIPKCGETAAPIYGMTCKKHKDLPKAQIKKYREARRAAKLVGKNGTPTKAKAKATRKVTKAKAKKATTETAPAAATA